MDSSEDSGATDVCVLEGRKAILAQARLLEALAERCGQPGAMHWLAYFLDGRDARCKQPYLILLLSPRAPGDPQPRSVVSAVLAFEYRILGWRTRAFSTDDVAGMRSVIAPESSRRQVAAMAVEVLMRLGAHVVLTSFAPPASEAALPALSFGRRDVVWAEQGRTIRKQLVLQDTFEATLATLGKATRFNLRYYRRRLTSEVGCSFRSVTSEELGETEMLTLNRASLNPVAEDECRLRYRSACRLPGGFLVALRGADGKLLSVVGGWRQGLTTVLHWQANVAGFEKSSVGTVMRSFFLENEVKRGARTLIVYGGASGSLQNSFLEERACDLVVRRQSTRVELMRWIFRLAASGKALTGRANHLALTLLDNQLQWSSPAASLSSHSKPQLERAHPAVAKPVAHARLAEVVSLNARKAA